MTGELYAEAAQALRAADELENEWRALLLECRENAIGLRHHGAGLLADECPSCDLAIRLDKSLERHQAKTDAAQGRERELK